MSISICMPGHNNWYQISQDPLDLIFSPYPFKALSINDAADLTAKLIAEKYNNLYLGLSGGYDSEFIANVLLRNKIPFTPVIFKDTYSKDSDYALYWCRKNKIDPLLIEQNIIDKNFIKILFQMSKNLPGKDLLAAINVVLSLKIAKIGGSYVNGCGVSTCDPPYPKPTGDVCEFTMTDFYTEILYNDLHPGAFFAYTPEIMYAYMKDIDHTLPIQEAKAKIYNLNFRPKIKPYHINFANIDMSGFTFTTFSKGKMSDVLQEFEKYIM